MRFIFIMSPVVYEGGGGPSSAIVLVSKEGCFSWRCLGRAPKRMKTSFGFWALSICHPLSPHYAILAGIFVRVNPNLLTMCKCYIDISRPQHYVQYSIWPPYCETLASSTQMGYKMFPFYMTDWLTELAIGPLCITVGVPPSPISLELVLDLNQ